MKKNRTLKMVTSAIAVMVAAAIIVSFYILVTKDWRWGEAYSEYFMKNAFENGIEPYAPENVEEKNVRWNFAIWVGNVGEVKKVNDHRWELIGAPTTYSFAKDIKLVATYNGSEWNKTIWYETTGPIPPSYCSFIVVCLGSCVGVWMTIKLLWKKT